MRRVAIVGAGELGATIARTLAGRDRPGEIVLIDESESVAAGKALDIRQAGPVDRFDTRVGAARDLEAAAGARVVILADRVDGGEWRGEPGLAALRRLARLDRDQLIVCAGAGQLPLVTQAVAELGIPRGRILASAPDALRSAVTAMVALEAAVSPADVRLSLLGRPPDGLVVPWRDASIGGAPLPAVLEPPALGRLQRRLPALWPPGPYALGSAASRVTEAALSGTRRSFSCFVVLDGEMGARRAGLVAPVQLDAGRTILVCLPALDPRERVLLDNALGE